jgi:hypothetical protein
VDAGAGAAPAPTRFFGLAILRLKKF